LHGAAFRRRAGAEHEACSLPRASLPIWSCSVWGLPCHRHYCQRGALLPHLFTLTPAEGSLLDQSRYRGGMFSVALAVHGPSRPCPGRYPAHCPAEFGLSSPGGSALARSAPAATARSSCQTLVYREMDLQRTSDEFHKRRTFATFWYKGPASRLPHLPRPKRNP
jgi:hypothetical protein